MTKVSLDVLGIFVFLCVIFKLFLYYLVSRKEKSYINVLTPSYLISLPAMDILPVIYLFMHGSVYSLSEYVFVYTCLIVESAAFVISYLYWPKVSFRLPYDHHGNNITLIAISSLAFAILIYSPILVQFSGDFYHARSIYTMTRTGYGIYSYTSSLLPYIAVIAVLFVRRNILLKSFVVIVSLFVLYLHGSKGQVLSGIFIILMYFVYVKRVKVNLKMASYIGAAISLFIALMFVFTMHIKSFGTFVNDLSGYSDYTRNAAMVVNSGIGPFWGKLTLEDNVLSVLPRRLYPNKPRDYGSFYLAKVFYPASFKRNQGTPAFGVGIQYADFGVFSIVYLMLFGVFHGGLLSMFVRRLKKTRSAPVFLVVVFLVGVSLIPTGVGWYLPEVLLISLILGFFMSIRFSLLHRNRVGFSLLFGGGE